MALLGYQWHRRLINCIFVVIYGPHDCVLTLASLPPPQGEVPLTVLTMEMLFGSAVLAAASVKHVDDFSI